MADTETAAQFLARVGPRRLTPEEARELYILQLKEGTAVPLNTAQNMQLPSEEKEFASRFARSDTDKS